MSIYGDLSERRAPIGPSGWGTWGPARAPPPACTAPNGPARARRASGTRRPRPRAARTGGAGGSPRGLREGRGEDPAGPTGRLRPGTAARRGGGPGCTPKLPGPGLGRAPKSGCVTAARSPEGLRSLRERPLRASSPRSAASWARRRLPGPGRGRGAPRRPPWRHRGPAARGTSGTRDLARARSEQVAGPTGRLRPRRFLRPRRGRPAQGPRRCSVQTGPALPTRDTSCSRNRSPDCPQSRLHSGFGVTPPSAREGVGLCFFLGACGHDRGRRGGAWAARSACGTPSCAGPGGPAGVVSAPPPPPGRLRGGSSPAREPRPGPAAPAAAGLWLCPEWGGRGASFGLICNFWSRSV